MITTTNNKIASIKGCGFEIRINPENKQLTILPNIPTAAKGLLFILTEQNPQKISFADEPDFFYILEKNTIIRMAGIMSISVKGLEWHKGKPPRNFLELKTKFENLIPFI